MGTEQSFIKYIYESFKKLIDTHGFIVREELDEKRSYMIEYSSRDFVIKVEKYFREFYVSLYKTNKPGNEINLLIY